MSRKMTSEELAASKQRRRYIQEQKSWEIYKQWQGNHIESIRPGQEIRSFHEFQAIYNDAAVGRRLANIKDAVQHQTSFGTFKSLSKAFKTQLEEEFEDTYGEDEFDSKTARRKALREYVREHIPKDFTRSKSTRELAALMKDAIQEFKEELLEEDPSLTSKELAKEVSSYFFGS